MTDKKITTVKRMLREGQSTYIIKKKTHAGSATIALARQQIEDEKNGKVTTGCGSPIAASDGQDAPFYVTIAITNSWVSMPDNRTTVRMPRPPPGMEWGRRP